MLDLAATLVFVGVAGFQYYDLETHDHPPDEEPEPHTQPLVIGVTLPAAIVYGIAASVGFRRTSDCRDALREFDEEDDASTAPPAAGEPGAPGMPCRRYPGVDDAWVCGRGTKCNAQHVCEPVE
jgi:hypothetical protein